MKSDFKHRVTLEVSIRRKEVKGLPGDDSSLHNQKVGSSLKGNGPLRGLEYEEEVKYLPEIIGVSPNDNEWRKMVQDYWNNISVPIPADGVTTNKLQGKVLRFTIGFTTKEAKEEFEKLISLEEKAEASKKGEVLEGLHDYILFRYCLVYGKVANRFEDIGKSAKILFYLYSTENETKVEHAKFKLRVKANELFTKMLMDKELIDSVLLLFEQDMSAYETLQDKHLALEALIKARPLDFIRFAEDDNLQIKADIKTAAERGIIKNPSNTESYYYGENNEILLGHSLTDVVLYWKSEQEQNVKIITAITARLKQL